jgi:hypothetical protein
MVFGNRRKSACLCMRDVGWHPKLVIVGMESSVAAYDFHRDPRDASLRRDRNGAQAAINEIDLWDFISD